MNYTPYIWPPLIAAALLSSIGFYVRRFGDAPAIRPFMLLTGLCAAWAGSYALSVATSAFMLKFIWVQTQMIVSLFVAPAVFALAFEYAQPGRHLTRKSLALILAVPVISVFFVLSSPYHQFFRTNFRLDFSSALPIMLTDKGPIYWVYLLYSFGLVLVSCGILVRALRLQKLYMPNTLLILLGIFIPFASDVLYTLGLTSFCSFDLTALAFVFAGLLYAWALIGFHLFDVIPIARNAVLDHMEDLVIVLDMHRHIVDFNRAAQIVFGLSQKHPFYTTPEVLPPDWAHLFVQHQDAFDLKEEITTGSGNQQQVYDLTISAIQDSRQRILGRVFLLHNVTKRKQTENALLTKDRAIASSIDAIAISDLNGLLTYVNPAFLKLWGYQDSIEVLGRDILEFLHLQEDVEQIIGRLKEYGGWTGESAARRKNGSTFDIKISASVVSDPIGKAFAVLAAFIDITEQNKAEEVIRLRLRLFEFAGTHSLHEVMQNALDEIGRITDSPIGFYHFVDADQKTLKLQTWSTRTLQEFCQAEGRGLHYDIDEAGVWVDCVRQRKPVIHNDYSALPDQKGLPDGHAEVIRELVVPILRMGRVVSILGVGNKPSDYDEKDIELVAYIADVVWEIVERKQAEDEIVRLSSFPHLNPNPVLEVDASGTITFYNSAALNILTRSGLSDPHVFLPADLDITQELKNGKTTIVSREIKIKDITIEETVHFAREFNSVRIYANDITERKKADEKLRQLSRAVEQSPASIVITDILGNIEYVNPRFTQVTGFSSEEVVGQNPRILNSGKTPPETYPKLWDALTTGKEWRGEFVNRKKNGEPYYESATLSPIVDSDGVITHYLAAKEDITERKMAEKQLELANEKLQTQLEQIQGLQAILREQAIRDPLTGLYNRRFLNETLERELARAKREAYPVSFVMIDIDHFKDVNDQFGHDAGDLVLKNLSGQFLQQTRSGDIVCRYGGEEFLLVLPNTTTAAAYQSAERCRMVFQDSRVVFGNTEIRATLSLGVATFPTHGANSKEILVAADNAMYLAKSRGRNRVMIPQENPGQRIFNEKTGTKK